MMVVDVEVEKADVLLQAWLNKDGEVPGSM